MLPALHAVQHHARYISKDLVPVFADVFNVTVSEVHGVITFYKDFRTEEPVGPIVQVCRAEACQSRGGRDVWDRALLAGDGKRLSLKKCSAWVIAHSDLQFLLTVDSLVA